MGSQNYSGDKIRVSPSIHLQNDGNLQDLIIYVTLFEIDDYFHIFDNIWLALDYLKFFRMVYNHRIEKLSHLIWNNFMRLKLRCTMVSSEE